MTSLLKFAQRWSPHVVAGFCSIVFLDSLRYKFTDHPNTQEIFGRLDAWAATLGAPGLFGHTGLFSQYVIGTGELIASSLFIAGIFLTRYRWLQALGALVGLAIMTGAISFHLFTPLGIDPNNDGGGLFMAACMVWVSCLIVLAIRWRELKVLGRKLSYVAAPAAAT